VALSTQKNYWSLGVSIKDVSAKTIIQKEVDLNKLILDSPTKRLNEEPPRNIYTLKTNYFVAPKSIESSASHDQQKSFKRASITDLILQEEYFEAAKQIIYLEKNNIILEEFHDWNDFYYWSGFIYYNLGNYNFAHENISKISNQKESPETLFLEALILKDAGHTEESNEVLDYIIKEFSNNDYSGYARDILNEK
jgi:tetratricopeptide (TPR) repeat protein